MGWDTYSLSSCAICARGVAIAHAARHRRETFRPGLAELDMVHWPFLADDIMESSFSCTIVSASPMIRSISS